MGVTNKYVDFILDNIIQDSITVQLYKPMEDGARMYVKLGPMIHCKVQIEVIEKYTRSAKLKLTFDKYEHEDIFFIPFSSSPDSIEMKTRKKIEKIVNKTFIDDDRTEDIKQMYKDKYRNFAESLSNFISEKKAEEVEEQIGRKYTHEERTELLKQAMGEENYNKAVDELMPFGGGLSEYYDSYKIPYTTK
jgi:hypothetical protein